MEEYDYTDYPIDGALIKDGEVVEVIRLEDNGDILYREDGEWRPIGDVEDSYLNAEFIPLSEEGIVALDNDFSDSFRRSDVTPYSLDPSIYTDESPGPRG